MLTDKKENELIQWKKFYEKSNNHVRVVKKKKERINLKDCIIIISSEFEMKTIKKRRENDFFFFFKASVWNKMALSMG